MPSTLVLALLGLLCVVAFWLSSLRRCARLPPSIPSLPLLGSLPHLPFTHLKLDVWAAKLGPIFSIPLPLGGGHVVVLSSAKVASDVLDKMSGLCSDRPGMIMGSTLMSHDQNLILAPYGETWKRHRKAAAESLSPSSLRTISHIQDSEALLLASSFLQDCSSTPDILTHCQRTATSIVWRALYGGTSLAVTAKGDESEEVRTAEDLIRRFFWAARPPGPIVDMFPVLMYLPKAIAPFKRYADWFYAYADDFYRATADVAVHRKTVAGGDEDNLTAELYEKREHLGLSEQDVAWVSGMLFLAGEETTSSVLQWLILALVLYPEVVQQAHAELDAVLDGARPTLADREKLPYVSAVVKEVIRWRPVGPMGAPHRATEDIHYQGYVIPKGTQLVSNLWSICRDPALFPDFDTFRPSRFLSSSGTALPHTTERFDDLAFGYGRRICVGKEMALQALFVDAATLLWAFDFQGRGEKVGGRSEDYVDTGLTIRPVPFSFELKPRSSAVVDYLKEPRVC